MIYFIAPHEGALFIRIERKGSMRPKDIVKMLEGHNYAAVFKCGMIYDNFLPFKSKWRHCLSGGRKGGKKRYKELLGLNLFTEFVC